MSEGHKFTAAVILVVIGGFASIAGVSLVFYWFGVPPKQATIAGAALVSIICKIADLAIALKGGTK